jgi:hypothetical protein
MTHKKESSDRMYSAGILENLIILMGARIDFGRVL